MMAAGRWASVLVAVACALFVLGPSTASAGAPRQSGQPAIAVAGPGNVESTVAALIATARQRVLVEAFALDDPAIVTALQQAERRGVDVRVMLDPVGLNTAGTEAALGTVGIRTRSPNPTYSVNHLDDVVIDSSAVVVLTTALVGASLSPGGTAYAAVDRIRIDVLQAASLFYDDWLRRPVTRFSHNLVILPDEASAIASLIASARLRIELYTSDLADPTLIGALDSARLAGAAVRILTPSGAGRNAILSAAGRGDVRLRDEGAGTLLVVDRRTVLLGSMDLASPTLTGHREMGIIIASTALGAALSRTFFSQFRQGAVLRPPPPPKPVRRTTRGRGTLILRVDVSPMVKLGGEASVAITTAAGAHVVVSVRYPAGSSPAAGTLGVSGTAVAKGSFIYRWIVSGAVKTGPARVHVSAALGTRSASADQTITLVA